MVTALNIKEKTLAYSKALLGNEEVNKSNVPTTVRSSKEMLDFAATATASEELLKHEVCYNAEKACTCQGSH